MTTVTVDGTKTKVLEAIHWLNKEFGDDCYDVAHSFPNQFWNFVFKDSKSATHFALKWLR